VVEVLKSTGQRESLKKDDLILVLRNDEPGEIPGTVDSIKGGVVWVNYGAYMSPLDKTDQIRVPSPEMKEQLLAKMREDAVKMKETLREVLTPLAEPIKKYDERHKPFDWLHNLFNITTRYHRGA
jgi:hypothetical protein